MREFKFQVLLSATEKAELERLARQTGVSSADVVRQLILAAARHTPDPGVLNAHNSPVISTN